MVLHMIALSSRSTPRVDDHRGVGGWGKRAGEADAPCGGFRLERTEIGLLHLTTRFGGTKMSACHISFAVTSLPRSVKSQKSASASHSASASNTTLPATSPFCR